MLIPTHIEVFEDEKYCETGTDSCPNIFSHPGKRYLCYKFSPKNVLKSECIDTGHVVAIKHKYCRQAYQAELKRREALEEKKPSEKPGEECDLDCVKYGLPENSYENKEVCDKCPNTPPF